MISRSDSSRESIEIRYYIHSDIAPCDRMQFATSNIDFGIPISLTPTSVASVLSVKEHVYPWACRSFSKAVHQSNFDQYLV